MLKIQNHLSSSPNLKSCGELSVVITITQNSLTEVMTNSFDLGVQNAKVQYLTLGVWVC